MALRSVIGDLERHSFTRRRGSSLHFLAELLGVINSHEGRSEVYSTGRGTALAPVMTPREIVSELDRYIVGQKEAKRAVAIALRNRWRRQLVPEDLRDEIAPKNIIMIGPTGVGKTEISRRLAKLAQAPFIKVEASKFTEVGYVGRDVESIIRDLTDLAVNMVKEEEKQKVEIKAHEVAEERVLDLLLPASSARRSTAKRSTGTSASDSGKTQENAPRRQAGRPLRRYRVDSVDRCR